MKISISNRLSLCASLVRPGERVADIGCDHGYLGISLLEHEIASYIYASDVNEMPLQAARQHAFECGFQDRMEFFLSDGLRSVPKDFDCAVLAGMGADTMIGILRDASWLCDSKYHLILQCQSKRPALRRFLAGAGYCIENEFLAKDGKFIYTVMDVCYRPVPLPAPWEYYISPQLAASGSPMLPEFLDRVTGGLEESRHGQLLSGQVPDRELTEVIDKLHELKKELVI